MHNVQRGKLRDTYRDPKIETVIDYGMVMSFWYCDQRIDDYNSLGLGLN